LSIRDPPLGAGPSRPWQRLSLEALLEPLEVCSPAEPEGWSGDRVVWSSALTFAPIELQGNVHPRGILGP
jgi:hypothetical protein